MDSRGFGRLQIQATRQRMSELVPKPAGHASRRAQFLVDTAQSVLLPWVG